MLQRVAWFGTIGHSETAEWTVRLTKVLEYKVASFHHVDESAIESIQFVTHDHGVEGFPHRGAAASDPWAHPCQSPRPG